MTPEKIGEHLTAAGLQITYQETTPDPHLEIPREALLSVSRKLAEDAELAFDSLMCLSGLDWPDPPDGALEVVYNLFSFKHRHRITLKVRCPREDPVIPSVAAIWPTAEWHEREAYDLIGVRFEGHPDPRRILLPDDWEGHPLRKDYKPPAFWHDIPVTVEIPSSTDDGN